MRKATDRLFPPRVEPTLETGSGSRDPCIRAYRTNGATIIQIRTKDGYAHAELNDEEVIQFAGDLLSVTVVRRRK